MGGAGVASAPLALLDESTFWSGLLMLRLGAPDGRTAQLAVLPDSVAPDQMRALCVACRAAARRAVDDPAQGF